MFCYFLDLLLAAYPDAPVVVVICDNGTTHHSNITKRWLAEHPRLLLIEGAKYSPQDNPVERIWAVLKRHIANTAPATMADRIRQAHAFFRNRSNENNLTTTAPWTSPWLPDNYGQDLWPGALAVPATAPAAAPADVTPPTAPRNLRVVNTTDFTWLSMTWDRSADASGRITYHVQKLQSANTWVEIVFTTMNLLTLEIGRPGTGGTFRVIAKDPANNVSVPSNELTATTLPDSTPPVMCTVSVVDAAPVSVRLSWLRATDNFRVSHYRVFLDGVPLATTSTTAYKVRNLKPGITYAFTVVAVDFSANQSAPSNPVIVTTPTSNDTEAPSVPGNLWTFGALGPGCAAELQWDAATDNVDPASALEYEVLFEDVTLTVVQGLLDAFVMPGTSVGPIELSVRAVDRSGNVSDPATVKHPCE